LGCCAKREAVLVKKLKSGIVIAIAINLKATNEKNHICHNFNF
jgi:hypothetical protein